MSLNPSRDSSTAFEQFSKSHGLLYPPRFKYKQMISCVSSDKRLSLLLQYGIANTLSALDWSEN